MTDAPDYQASGNGDTPLDSLGVIASQDVMITPLLRHAEFFTMRGLLTVLWHEPAASIAQSPLAIVACGGAMGGLLGPANGLYQVLGEYCAAHGIPLLRVDYRRPNDMDSCCIDVAAAAQLAIAGAGAERVVLIGHSFGGAVAVRVGVGLGEMVAGVVTLATQSAGCEIAAGLRDTPLLLFHGDRDEILPLQASEVVRSIAGTGELVVLANDGHLLAESGPIILEKLCSWLNTLPGVQR